MNIEQIGTSASRQQYFLLHLLSGRPGGRAIKKYSIADLHILLQDFFTVRGRFKCPLQSPSSHSRN